MAPLLAMREGPTNLGLVTEGLRRRPLGLYMGGKKLSSSFALVVAPGTYVVHATRASLLTKREERHQVGFAPRGSPKGALRAKYKS